MGQPGIAFWSEGNDVPIEALDLSVRSYNCLKRSQINTIRQLLSLRKQELLSIRNLTPASYEEIRERLIERQFMQPAHLIGPFADEEHDDETSL